MLSFLSDQRGSGASQRALSLQRISLLFSSPLLSSSILISFCVSPSVIFFLSSFLSVHLLLSLLFSSHFLLVFSSISSWCSLFSPSCYSLYSLSAYFNCLICMHSVYLMCCTFWITDATRKQRWWANSNHAYLFSSRFFFSLFFSLSPYFLLLFFVLFPLSGWYPQIKPRFPFVKPVSRWPNPKIHRMLRVLILIIFCF